MNIFHKLATAFIAVQIFDTPKMGYTHSKMVFPTLPLT